MIHDHSLLLEALLPGPEIRRSRTPEDNPAGGKPPIAKSLGDKNKASIRADWESVKETVTSPFFMTVKAFQDSGYSFVSPFGTTNAALEGKDPASRSGEQRASTSVRQTDDRTLVITIRHDGRVAATEHMVLATDFKTMTLTIYVAGRDKPTVLAFERK